jgi:LPS sulfotransferase NodH
MTAPRYLKERLSHMTPSDKTRFAILALQRTGTNMLGSVLRNTGKIHMYGEVFYPALGTGDLAQDVANGLFFPYWRDRIATDPRELLISNLNTFDSVFTTFLERLYTQVGAGTIGIDVKYEQVAAFPRVLDILRNRGVRVIHLERKNYLARIVSQLVLNRRIETGEVDVHRSVAKVEPLTIKPARALASIREDEARNWMLRDRAPQDPARYLHVYYEDVVNPGPTLRSILDFLGLPEVEIAAPDTVKQVPQDFSRLIANYDELAAALTEAGYERFL